MSTILNRMNRYLAMGIFSGLFSFGEVEAQEGLNPLKKRDNYKTSRYGKKLDLIHPPVGKYELVTTVPNYKQPNTRLKKMQVSVVQDKPTDRLSRNYKKVR